MDRSSDMFASMVPTRGRRLGRLARRAALAEFAVIVAMMLSGCGSSPVTRADVHDRRGHVAASAPGSGAASVAQTPVPSSRYGIVEKSLAFGPQTAASPWDIPVTVSLTSPSGRVTQINGYYSGPGTWRFRFAPPQRGRWRWQATLSNGASRLTRGGTFQTQRQPTAGFVRHSPFNPYLWSVENGAPYYPLGLTTCLVDDRKVGTPFYFVLDGGFRPQAGATGSLFGAGGRNADLATYIRTYAHAGFNLFRWSVDNCSFGLYKTISPAGNVYDPAGGRFGDQLVRTLHRYGMRVYMTFFGFNPPEANGGTDLGQMKAIERYVRYVVARYGAYVDFWELMNEATRAPAWYSQIVAYLRSIDPYHHPISTSFPPADLSLFGINSPHWYGRENELTSDLDTFQHLAQYKSAGKPVIVGEQGNSVQNWDPGSGVRMRLRIWTTFFAQGALVLWNEVAFKDFLNPGSADIWIGPTERHYTSVLSHFTAGFDPRARTAPARVSHAQMVRGYELDGPQALALYLTNYTNHLRPTRGITVSIDPAFRGTATWVDPATGRVLKQLRVRRGRQQLRVPAFTTDIALKAVR